MSSPLILARGPCRACGVSAWHPEVRACPFSNCELRAHSAHQTAAASVEPIGAAAGCSIPFHNGGVPEQEARDHVC